MKAPMFRKSQVWVLAEAAGGVAPRVLLLQLVPERGGAWQPVTGGVEEGESFEQGALREAIEETGLPFAGEPEELGLEHRFESRHGGTAVERAFLLRLRQEAGGSELPAPRLDPREHVAFRWVSPEEARAALPYETQRRALELAMGRLSKRDSKKPRR